MPELFNYDNLFNQALENIKHLRSPYTMKMEEQDLQWDIVEQQKIFDFFGHDIEKYFYCVRQSKKISIGCLYEIIVSLFRKYDYDIEPISLKDIKEQSNIRFAFKDIKNNTLLFFKEIEESNFWKVSEPDEIQKILNEFGMTKCKYIYLMWDYAYLQLINHNDDVSDPGRGYNCYSIQWFFKNYFGEDEYENFLNGIKNYISEVKKYLGYILIKPLESYELLDFRRTVEKEILLHSYEMLLKKTTNKKIKFILDRTDFEELRQQYFNKKIFLVMLSNRDFAESLITSEWLYDSMKKAQAIDLTVIGMGYFKAIEQLMFQLISFHKNEKRKIKEKKSKNRIEFNDTNIEKNILDTSIGAMANFYKENLDLLSDKLSESAKAYIRETFFAYAKLRNGFFHKENIHEWGKIREIRNATFNIMFLLLGGQKFNEFELLELGMPKEDIESDYYRLCEYVNYHKGEIFFLDFGEKGEVVVCACSDRKAEIVENQYFKYSGVYFRKLEDRTEPILLTENNLPERISLGKLDIKQTTEIMFNPVKVKVVYEDKKYVGPLLLEEYRRLD